MITIPERSSNKSKLGFTLVEMAIVLVVVGLLVSAFLAPLSAQQDLKNFNETQKNLDEIKEALIGYAIANGHFPCPAISGTNGSEDRTGTTCTGAKRVGHLPWAELGMPKLDSWSHIYRYSVTLTYADSASKITLLPQTPRDISIQTRDAIGNIQNTSNANDIPVVIMSMGKNGVWSFADNGTQVADSSASNIDEDTNGNGNGRLFLSRTPTANTAVTGGEIDDIVTWISTSVYINRMVAAGQLP
jgi:prepilin-type N-terminal cleavage/methylation domain-containing protein